MRAFSLSVLILAALASPAAAIEMFTDFHNGEKIGFPARDVPAAIYGRGGWNSRAIGRVAVPSGLPTTIPSGDRANVGRWRKRGPACPGYAAPSTWAPSGEPQLQHDPVSELQPATILHAQLGVAPESGATTTGL